MRRTISTCAVFLLYWTFVVYFLRLASPVFSDAAGPERSFYWGRMPFPSPDEYSGRQHYYDLLYAVPYLAAGLAITIVGCAVVPMLLRRVTPASPRPFLTGAAATSALLLLLMALSDTGDLLRLWNGPRFLLRRNLDGYSALAIAMIVVPRSVLAGIVEAAGRRGRNRREV